MESTIHVNVVVLIMIATIMIALFSAWQLYKTGMLWHETRDLVMALVAIFMVITLLDEIWSLALQILDIFTDRGFYLDTMRWFRLLERLIALALLLLMKHIYIKIEKQDD